MTSMPASLAMASASCAIAPQSTVTIRLEPRGQDLIVHVEDTGPGIPEEALQRVFEPFYRVDVERSGNERGAGLGLAIVRRIMELHGRRIEVASSVGEGTVFTFRLAAAM